MKHIIIIIIISCRARACSLPLSSLPLYRVSGLVFFLFIIITNLPLISVTIGSLIFLSVSAASFLFIVVCIVSLRSSPSLAVYVYPLIHQSPQFGVDRTVHIRGPKFRGSKTSKRGADDQIFCWQCVMCPSFNLYLRLAQSIIAMLCNSRPKITKSTTIEPME